MRTKLLAEEIKELQEKKIKEQFPDNPSERDKQACLGVVYYDKEDYKAAIKELTEVLEQDSKHVFALEFRGHAYRSDNQFQLAVEDLTKAIELGGETIMRKSHRADAYRQLGKYEESVADFDWVIENHGNSKFRNLRRADALNKLGIRPEDALNDANTVFKMGERSRFLHNVRGTAHLHLGHTQEAVNDFSEAIKLSPNGSYAYEHRAVAHMEMGQIEEARADFEKALELTSSSSFAKKHLDILEAQQKLVQEKFPTDPTKQDQFACLVEVYIDKNMNKEAARVLVIVAKEYMKIGEFRKAEDSLKKALDLVPNLKSAESLSVVLEKQKTYLQQKFSENASRIDILACLGTAYFDKDDYDSAIEILNTVLEKDSDHVFALEYLGHTYRLTNDYKLAEENLTKVIELDGNNVMRTSHRADVYRNLGKYEESVADFDWVIKNHGNSTFRNLRRADALIKLGIRFDDALNDANIAYEKGERSAFVYNVRGTAHLYLGHTQEAVNDYSEAIKLWKKGTYAYAHRGIAYLEMGEPDNAETGITEALKLSKNYQLAKDFYAILEAQQKLVQEKFPVDPSKQDHLLCLAEVYINKDMNKAAIRVLVKAAKGYMEIGKFENAVESLNKLLELDQNSKFANDHLAILKEQRKLVQKKFPTDPTELDKLACLGAAYEDKCMHEDAVRILTKVLENDSNHPLALATRGEAYRMQSNYALSKIDLDKAILIKPDYGYAYASRGATHHELKEFKAAASDLTLAIGNGWRTRFSYIRLARALNNLGEYDEALKNANCAINDFGENSVLGFNVRGYAYLKLGNSENAIDDFTNAIQKDPNDSYALAHRAQAYLSKNNAVNAKADLEKALQRSPIHGLAKKLWVVVNLHFKLIRENFPKTLSNYDNEACLASAFSEIGEYDESIKRFKMVLKFKPDHEQARNWLILAYQQRDAEGDQAEVEKLLAQDHENSSSSEDEDSENVNGTSFALRFQMINELYEQQQKALEKHQKVANVLYIVGIFVAPGLAHLAIYLIKKATHWNDVVKMSAKASNDETFKRWKWGKEWNKISHENDDGTFDLYFINDKTLKTLGIMDDKSSKVDEQSEEIFNSAISSAA